MIQHVKLSDSQILIPTPEGPKYIGPHNFHYHEILRQLDTAELSDILPLFTPPSCPNGVFHLFVTTHNHLLVKQYQEGNITTYFLKDNTWHIISIDEKQNITFVGLFPSFDDITYNFPEYFI